MKTYITGYGMAAAGSPTSKEFFNLLEKGEHALEVSTVNGIDGEKKYVVGLVHEDMIDQDERYLSESKLLRMLISPLKEALCNSGLTTDDLKNKQVAILGGTSCGPGTEMEKYFTRTLAGDFSTLNEKSIGNISFHLSPFVGEFLGIEPDLTFTLSTNCTSGMDAAFFGNLLIKSGQADICIVVGSETPVNGTLASSFEKVHSLRWDGEMDSYGKAFGRSRNGFVMAEGAGVLILESEDSVNERGGKKYAELANIQTNNDGKGLHGSDHTGKRMVDVVKKTVKDYVPSYINSQALGLLLNDRVERKVSNIVFNNEVPLTSTKGYIGHTFGSAGIFQIISSIYSMEKGVIFSSLNVDKDNYKELPIVSEDIFMDIDSVLVTTHGYGGNNTCCLLKKA